MRKLLSLFILIGLILSFATVAFAEIKVPSQVGDIYVQDYANVLDSQDTQSLIQLGKKLEDSTTAQLAVLTIPSLEGNDIKEYANTAFRKYGLGNKEKNNGVLLLYSQKDREIRIEVGYGLEGVVTDIRSGAILDQSAIPYLKKGETSLALTNTYKALYNVILNGSEKTGHSKTSTLWDNLKIILIVVFVVIVIAIDMMFFNGVLTYFIINLLPALLNSSGGSRGGGGGSSGGGGSDRKF
ncbi:YgcG family protein [Bacillus sp. EAC]|uniref:TPM domain-containing protein n=1 Tax=Bacillus sp. EAC TaxID=1978338 RepID=UPI000B453D58|nr:TPM domain-containing protein [Bacillus sp. EAC]